MSKHTPGEWQLLPYTDEDVTLHVIAGEPAYEGTRTRADWIASLDVEDKSFGEVQANALLMTAAPELLAELKKVQWAGGRHWTDQRCPECGSPRALGKHRTGCSIAAAIAKAEGRTP